MKKTKNVLAVVSRGYIVFCCLSLGAVSVMALFSPQSVMDMVAVRLDNSDAISSIRGVYGGVGCTLIFTLLWLQRRQLEMSLSMLAMLWGSYVLSRLITLMTEGNLGAFARQWLAIESVLFIAASVLWALQKRRVF